MGIHIYNIVPIATNKQDIISLKNFGLAMDPEFRDPGPLVVAGVVAKVKLGVGVKVDVDVEFGVDEDGKGTPLNVGLKKEVVDADVAGGEPPTWQRGVLLLSR
jgi:hypothetical protein